MRVVLDGVFNHCGRGFWRFHHVAEAGAALARIVDWFHLDGERLAAGRPLVVYPGAEQEAEIRAAGGARAWVPARRPGASSATRAGGVCPRCPSCNVDNPETRAYLLDVAEHWLRFGIDGWRLDVAEEIDGRLLGGVPAALPGGPTRTPTWWPRSGSPSPSGSRATISMRS